MAQENHKPRSYNLRPSSCRRRLSSDAVMVGANCTPKSYHCRPSSGHKRGRMCIPSLPKDVIFKILICLPADMVYKVMRYVCRDWYDIITDPLFIDAHLLEAPVGILSQSVGDDYCTHFVEMGKHGVKVTNLNLTKHGSRNGRDFSWFRLPDTEGPYKIINFYYRVHQPEMHAKFPGKILASCNGLVLFADVKFYNCLHVANLALKQWINLPPLRRVSQLNWATAGLAYAASCREYKVTYTWRTNHRYGESCHCSVLTVGVDKRWRYLGTTRDMPYVPPEAKNLLCNQSLSIGGFIHWPGYPFVLSMDVESESFYASSFPDGYATSRMQYLAMDSCFSFMARCSECTWELWALSELKSGGWRKIRKIDLTAATDVLKCRFPHRYNLRLCPVSLLRCGELVIFQCLWEGYFAVYNVNTGAMDFFKTSEANISFFGAHVRSLVPLKRIKK